MTTACTQTLKVRDYIDAIVNIIRSPSKFYESISQDSGLRKPLMFLVISAAFNSTVSMSYFFESSLMMGVIYMFNALAMTFLAAVFTFLLVGIMPGSKTRFDKVFGIHAYASGAIMVVSWIPALGMILELVRAALVIVGLHRVCQLGWIKSLLIVAGTAMLLLAFVWSLAPVLMEIKGLVS